MFKIKVPATSANLGAGFDCLALAIDMYNTFTFTDAPKGFRGDNLIYRSYYAVFEHLGVEIIDTRIETDSNIPISRGLGSSASCIVAGVLGANKILDFPLSGEDVLNLANSIEGHPDNVSAALYGGITISAVKNSKVLTNKIIPKELVKLVALVPEFELSTKSSREVIPRELTLDTAVFNIQRTALLISSLINGNLDMLKYATEDKIHQPYRMNLIENSYEIFDIAYELGALAVFLSGAGPTIMCIVNKDDNEFKQKLDSWLGKKSGNWKTFEHRIETEGAKIIN
ncbi:homoserine kinase [Soehngenia saccharolytica]|nr:homoserine kinase [Soehngenia saccharolytica]